MELDNAKIDYACPYPQTYHCILTHKLSPCLKMFGDFSNKIYLSDNDVPGTIDIRSPWDCHKFGELAAWSWVAQNFRPQDYVSLNHYRRRLSLGLGNVVPEPINLGVDMAQQTAYYHSPVLTDAIMKTLSPLEQNLFTTSQQMYLYNMGCLNVGFVQQLFFPYLSNKIMLLESILGRNYVPDASFYVDRPGKDTREWYQTRLYGFALERYVSLFWLQNQDKINSIGRVKLLEERTKNVDKLL